MTNEDRRRTMEFILEQQAQMTAHLQQLEEERIRDRPRLVRLEESFLQLVELNKTVDFRLDRLESRSTVLESNTAILERNTATLQANAAILQTNMAALAAAQAHVDEQFSALIKVVRQDRNSTP